LLLLTLLCAYCGDGSGHELAKQRRFPMPSDRLPGRLPAASGRADIGGRCPIQGIGRYETDFKPGKNQHLASGETDGADLSCPATQG
jgi:hypothetical protein